MSLTKQHVQATKAEGATAMVEMLFLHEWQGKTPMGPWAPNELRIAQMERIAQNIMRQYKIEKLSQVEGGHFYNKRRQMRNAAKKMDAAEQKEEGKVRPSTNCMVDTTVFFSSNFKFMFLCVSNLVVSGINWM